MIKKVARIILKLFARTAVKRNKYKIVAITGSVGKTSTKKAIASVLSSKCRVLFTEEGYNTELGLPLTLFEKKVPKNNAGWFLLLITSPFLALKKRHYDFAVLEMGADKPGDIEYLIGIANPSIAVVTNVSQSHLEMFPSVDRIAKEKEKILSRLDDRGVGVLNIDNVFISKMSVPAGAKRVTFGKKSKDIKIIKQDIGPSGSTNYFSFNGKDIKIQSISLGEHILYTFASAIAVGISQKIEVEEIIKALESFRPVKGRLNIIKGLKGSIIIDDSYNANPTSMKNALNLLGKYKGVRKIALLGTMGELGKYEKESHEEIGTYLVGKCDILVTVGEAAEKYLAASAVKKGMDTKNVFSFENSVLAGEFLKSKLVSGDVVLAKGSQNKTRMERAVKKIMNNPEDAQKLLCRQGKEWERRK